MNIDLKSLDTKDINVIDKNIKKIDPDNFFI